MSLHEDLKDMEFNHPPRGAFGIGISMKVTRDGPHPIRDYREKQLETEVICDKCTLRYAIFGVFGWCPDCGAHNSAQILGKNLELAKKELALAQSVEKDLAEHLIGDALENVVSAFDGFARGLRAQGCRNPVSEPRRGTQARAGNVRIRLRRWSPGGGLGDGMPGISEAPFIGA